MATKSDIFFNQSQILEREGWTKKAVQLFLGEPEQLKPNPYYKSAASIKLWSATTLRSAESSPEFEAHKVKLAKRKKGVDYNFGKKYSNANEAIPKACEYLFNLNRYTKHSSCSEANKTEIYSLKNQFLEFLYKNDYCKEAYLHELKLPQKECFRCDGTGQRYDYATNDYYCYNCDGTGIFLRAKTLRFIVFNFQVEGVKYCWHQPKTMISYPVEIGTTPTALNKTEIKPLEMSKANFAKGKALIRWALENLKT